MPFGRWLFFHYLQAALLAALFAGCCLAAGHALVLRILGRMLPLDEHVAIAFPLGVLAFFCVSFTCGLLGLYGAPFFVLSPALLLLLGGPHLLRKAARSRRWESGKLSSRALRLVRAGA